MDGLLKRTLKIKVNEAVKGRWVIVGYTDQEVWLLQELEGDEGSGVALFDSEEAALNATKADKDMVQTGWQYKAVQLS